MYLQVHVCTKGNNVRAVKKAKSEILARVKAFNTSGFKIKKVWTCLLGTPSHSLVEILKD